MRLSSTYSSSHTGEKCYMVEAALYKDILLAVTVQRQNQQRLAASCDELEAHMLQIENSHERISMREKSAIGDFVLVLTQSHMVFRALHSARLKSVLAAINALKDSMTSSDINDDNTKEITQLRHQISQYTV
jgi:hypothetical protein